jgi:hypothetical protein
MLRGLKLARLEGATTGKNTPGDARELVGERDCQHVAVQPLFGRLDPALEPMTLPTGSLYEQNAQIAVTALRYLAKDSAVPSGDWARDPARRRSRDL